MHKIPEQVASLDFGEVLYFFLFELLGICGAQELLVLIQNKGRENVA